MRGYKDGNKLLPCNQYPIKQKYILLLNNLNIEALIRMKISDQGGNEDDEREESSYVGLCEEGRDDCRVMALGD